MPPTPTPSDPPSTPSPHLTPQFCLDTTALRDFLRLSRAAVDDSISAHLNALIHPAAARGPFTSAAPQPGPRSRQNVPIAACAHFRCAVLFQSWRARDNVLTYCARVAEAPEEAPRPTAAESAAVRGAAVAVAVAGAVGGGAAAAAAAGGGGGGAARGDGRESTGPRMNTDYWGQPTVVDERTDPYSARDYSYTRQSKAEELKTVLANERGVERIVRRRTWGVLGERCVGGAGDGGGGWSAAADDGWESEYQDSTGGR
ncbi:hypothetical protein FH972_022162 [Carpinus fangiana]|uniref:Uncharacterized protein n=1 Tax=Carpinus fangiana TaxID=176857 RepID=A0A5N6KRS9_9ROSI|nr:hypothetical protein FH972_022162 [Carpinus fangiana]